MKVPETLAGVVQAREETERFRLTMLEHQAMAVSYGASEGTQVYQEALDGLVHELAVLDQRIAEYAALLPGDVPRQAP